MARVRMERLAGVYCRFAPGDKLVLASYDNALLHPIVLQR